MTSFGDQFPSYCSVGERHDTVSRAHLHAGEFGVRRIEA
jgi:hypothetical protein